MRRCGGEEARRCEHEVGGARALLAQPQELGLVDRMVAGAIECREEKRRTRVADVACDDGRWPVSQRARGGVRGVGKSSHAAKGPFARLPRTGSHHLGASSTVKQ